MSEALCKPYQFCCWTSQRCQTDPGQVVQVICEYSVSDTTKNRERMRHVIQTPFDLQILGQVAECNLGWVDSSKIVIVNRNSFRSKWKLIAFWHIMWVRVDVPVRNPTFGAKRIDSSTLWAKRVGNFLKIWELLIPECMVPTPQISKLPCYWDENFLFDTTNMVGHLVSLSIR